MKKLLLTFVFITLIFSSCSPPPYSEEFDNYNKIYSYKYKENGIGKILSYGHGDNEYKTYFYLVKGIKKEHLVIGKFSTPVGLAGTTYSLYKNPNFDPMREWVIDNITIIKSESPFYYENEKVISDGETLSKIQPMIYSAQSSKSNKYTGSSIKFFQLKIYFKDTNSIWYESMLVMLDDGNYAIISSCFGNGSEVYGQIIDSEINKYFNY